jgi:hypothetical protein
MCLSDNRCFNYQLANWMFAGELLYSFTDNSGCYITILSFSFFHFYSNAFCLLQFQSSN